ncbi:MAG: hypothetical protein IT353_22560, partial [Gemmatimonadaceae bacterium]|nr:hypothetical protein [Gemmatimonadaceae bacterium]
EFAPYGQSERLRKYPVHWVDTKHDTIVVFDGRRISRFDVRAGYVDAYPVPSDVVGGIVAVGNVRIWQGHVLIGTYDTGMLPGSRRRLVVRAVASDTSRVVAEMLLSPLPKTQAGQPFDGLAEAKPTWDLLGNCIVATDGHSDSLIVTDVVSGRAATLIVPLPRRFQSGAEKRETKLLGSSDVPLPHLQSRVRSIIANPNGWIWMLPSEPMAGLAPRVEVWRVHVLSRRLQVDTVPTFPLTWDNQGCGLGIRADANDEPQLIRMCNGA